MSDGEQAFPEICPKLLEFSRYLGITWNAQALAGTFRIILYIKRLLLDAGGMGRCHIVVKTIGIVRYLTGHLTAEGSTSVFYSYAFATFLCYIVCAAMVP